MITKELLMMVFSSYRYRLKMKSLDFWFLMLGSYCGCLGFSNVLRRYSRTLLIMGLL